ncbi:hypothetical protein [Bradyrhizobium pachyrhizi]|uniref:hypothetical protein n=1 Tax=Bradyrhizobium pachyrhizi TaxID=280333 RepID=UPI000A7F6330|nr:hypothetical protein [Bradyrhizobium pachyrhizi]
MSPASPLGKRPLASPEPTCYFSMAQHRNVADPEPAPVVGVETKPYGHDLAGPQWSRDLAALPKERPTGECIDALNPIDAVWFDPDYIAPEEGGSNGEA